MNNKSRIFKIAIIGNGSASNYLQTYLMNIDSELFDSVEIDIFSRSSDNNYVMRNIASNISIRNLYIKFSYHTIDLDKEDDIKKFINLIRNDKYDILFNMTRAISNIKYGSKSFSKGIGYGVWLPLALKYSYIIGKSLNLAKCSNTLYINSSYPDATVPIIRKFVYNNTLGIGNASHIIPRLTSYLGKDIVKNLDIIGGHYLDIMFCGNKEIKCNNYIVRVPKSVDKLGKLDNFSNILKDHKYIRLPEIQSEVNSDYSDLPSGGIKNLAIAEDAYLVAESMINNSRDTLHLIGYKGLTGSIPCKYDGYSFRSSDSISDINYNKLNLICSDNLEADGVSLIDLGRSMRIKFDKDSLDKLESIYGIRYPHSEYNLHDENDIRDLINLCNIIKF